jgi:hypothetical protein
MRIFPSFFTGTRLHGQNPAGCDSLSRRRLKWRSRSELKKRQETDAPCRFDDPWNHDVFIPDFVQSPIYWESYC